jgi:hypothetical protein
LNVRYKAGSQGQEPSLRDSQSCTQINNTCYIFGGQGEEDKLFNDLYMLDFEIAESEKKFIAKWTLVDVQGIRPPARTSHSATSYKSNYLFIIGGEGYSRDSRDNRDIRDSKDSQSVPDINSNLNDNKVLSKFLTDN